MRRSLFPSSPLWLAPALLGVAFAGVSACATTQTTTNITPITGILVRSDALTAGHGCGTGDTQVYKYVAIVSALQQGDQTQAVVAAAFDCFADATFVDLPTTATSVFRVDVLAYNQRSYDADAVNARVVTPADPSTWHPTADLLQNTRVVWSSTCTATQQANIEVLAVCSPLASRFSAAEVTLPTGSFVAGDAGTLACDVNYAAIKGTYEIDGADTSGEFPLTRCGTPVVVPVAAPPALVTFHVKLLTSSGSSVGAITCTEHAPQTDAERGNPAICTVDPLP